MEIEKGLNPNCSEAVFRFGTLDPKKIQKILQIIADKISSYTDFKPHKNQRIPLFKMAEEYDTNYKRASDKEWNKHMKRDRKLAKMRDDKKITEEEFDKLYKEEDERFQKLQYPKEALLKACAGLGDNEAVVTIEKDKGAFRLNIGNNDISEGDMSWVEQIKGLNIKVEEAETCKELVEYARDCTCGCVFGF